MGVYYKIICEARQEAIEPAEIATPMNPRGFGIKQGPVIFDHHSKIIAFWAVKGDWKGEAIRFVGDDCSAGAELYNRTWLNVTKKAIEAFNSSSEIAASLGVVWLSSDRE